MKNSKRCQICKNEWNGYPRTEKYKSEFKNSKSGLNGRLDIADEISELTYCCKLIQTDIRREKREEDKRA